MLTSSRPNVLTSLLLLCLAVLGAAGLGLATVPRFPRQWSLLPGSLPLVDGPGVASVPTGRVLETRLAKGTEGQLRQIALHLSKMQGGASIGGFPGFEPPDDDEDYQRKIKDRSYTAEEADHWLKEVNGFLKWLVRKNPGMSLEKILQRQGLTQIKIEEFIEALQDAQYYAAGVSGHGVNPETVQTLTSLMRILGVPIWQY